jgi:hypothetical protein
MSDPRRQWPAGKKEGIRRRDFLALGAATAAATAIATLPAAASSFAARSPLGVDLTSGERLSVGYIAGSDEWVGQLDLPWEHYGADYASFELEIIPAEAMTVGSGLALATIELSVHGLFPRLPEPGTSAWKSLYLFASVPAPPEMIFGPDPVAFLAWSARMDPQPSQAAKVRPVLSTGVDGGLRLGLEMRAPAAAGTSRGNKLTRPGTGSVVLERTTNFTVDDLVGRPRLQEGVYLLSCGKQGWDRGWRGSLDELRALDGFDSVAIGIRRLE